MEQHLRAFGARRQGKDRRRGFTLPEMFVAMGLFGVIMVVLATSLTGAARSWRRASGVATIQTQLGKAQSSLVEELEKADFDQIEVANGPSSLGQPDSTAVWFLSNVDPTTGQPVTYNSTNVLPSPPAAPSAVAGRPFWQRNILYYAVVPNNHVNTFGMTCSGGAGPLGLNDTCPHKVLIRKVIDYAPSGFQELIPPGSIGTYLTRPNGFDVSGMTGEAGLVDADAVQIKAHSLLFMGVEKAPNAALYPEEVVVDLRALNLPAASKEVAVGTDQLATSRFTVQQLMSVFPRN